MYLALLHCVDISECQIFCFDVDHLGAFVTDWQDKKW